MKRLALIVAIATLSVMAVAPTPVSAQGGVTVPITGSGSGGSFVGTFAVNRFVATDSGIAAVGTLTGSVTNTATGVVTGIRKTVALPTSIGTTTCDILHLDLGPLSIDLLGLNIDLSRIVLDITAQSGAGNLLGNLLCAVAGLLDDPGGLARLLNQILGILG